MSNGVRVAYGIEGTADDFTTQDPFPSTTKCQRCGKTARIALTIIENGGNRLVRNEHQNNWDEIGGGFWLHDEGAFAIYLCMDIDCRAATTLYNQA